MRSEEHTERVPFGQFGRNERQFGFSHYLKDMFDAPEAVLSYICKQYNVHNIPVGNDDTKKHINAVLQQTRFYNFYTTNHQYNVRVSKYGNRARSTRSSELKQSKLLTASMDMERVETLQREAQHFNDLLQNLRATITELQDDDQQLLSQMEVLRKKKKVLVTRRDFRKTLMGRIEQKKDCIKHCKESSIDIDAEREKGNAELLKLSTQKINMLHEHHKLLLKWAKMVKLKVCLSCEHCAYSYQKSKLETEQSESQQLLNSLETKVQVMLIKVNNAQKEAKKCFETAKRTGGDIATNDLSTMIDRAFPNLPNELEDVEREIVSLKAQADCCMHSDESVLHEYEMWKAKQDQLDRNVLEKNTQLVHHREEMDDILKRWLPPLRKLVSQINTKFGHYFANLQCAGEVGLNMGDNDKDYSNFGISIKVKYRANDQLRELTSHYQSGGERSVATILYLLALQEFINLPFSCVDEINQGMDSTNERLVFSMMTKTVCDENRCQYFLVTPKLLPDLEFGPNITVHCIYNGSVSLLQRKWDISKFLEKRSA